MAQLSGAGQGMNTQFLNQKKFDNSCAVILGDSINGYLIMRELWSKGIKNIVLFYRNRSLCNNSNKIILSQKIDLSAATLKNKLTDLSSKFKRLIIYPTLDYQVKNLSDIYDSIQDFCFIAFNHANILTCMNKYYQYQFCKTLGIPVPESIALKHPDDIKNTLKLKFPIIIKPQAKLTLNDEIFKNTIIQTHKDLDRLYPILEKKMYGGGRLLASEIIPGGENNLYSYFGYRNKEGKILNEWTGRKLSSFPDNFGVFASGVNELNPIVLNQGRALLNGMNLMGMCQSEFRFDARDNSFKFIEINIRTTLLSGLAHLSGVNLTYTQYLDGIGERAPRQNQITDKKIHLVTLNNELRNLAQRKNYWKVFKYNLFRGDINYWLPWDKQDKKPFMFWFLGIPKRMIKRLFNRFVTEKWP